VRGAGAQKDQFAGNLFVETKHVGANPSGGAVDDIRVPLTVGDVERPWWAGSGSV
jgi:hypothetical protein